MPFLGGPIKSESESSEEHLCAAHYIYCAHSEFTQMRKKYLQSTMRENHAGLAQLAWSMLAWSMLAWPS